MHVENHIVDGDKKKKPKSKLSFKNLIVDDVAVRSIAPTDSIIPQKTEKLSFKNIIAEPQGQPVDTAPKLQVDELGTKIDFFPKGAKDTLAAPVEEEPKGIFDQLAEAFTGSELETDLSRTLPNLAEVGSDNKLKVLGIVLSSVDPQEQADMLVANIEGARKFNDEKGNQFIEFPNGEQAIINRPGFSSADARNLVVTAAKFYPAAKLAALGKTLLRKIGLGGLLSGATSAIDETVQSQFGGEFDAGEVALSTGLGLLGEAGAAGFKALKTSRQAKAIGAEKEFISETAESIAKSEAATKATGVELFPAQKTLVPSTLEKQSFIATLPAAQRASVSALKKQNKQAGEAVEKLLETISESDVIQTGAEKFRTVAQRAIKIKERFRSEIASPIYKQAFRRQRKGQLGLINTRNLEVKLIKIAEQFDPKGQIAQNMRKALEKIKVAKGSLQKLHMAKIEIDQVIEGFGIDAVGNTTKRFLTDIKTDLVEQLTKQSPSYRAARSEFIRLTPEVEAIRGSILGKVAKIDDTQLKSISRKIFDPEEANVGSVLKTKKIIDNVDDTAWNDLLRVEVERRLGSIKAGLREGAGETVENIPAQLNRALFGNQKQSAILFNSVSKEQQKNLRYLQTVLKRAGAGRLGGSQTATREEIKKDLQGGVINFFSKLFTPFESAKGGLSGITFDKNVKKLSEALFDTKWQPQLSKIRKINPNTPEAARLWTQLLKNIDNDKEVKK